MSPKVTATAEVEEIRDRALREIMARIEAKIDEMSSKMGSYEERLRCVELDAAKRSANDDVASRHHPLKLSQHPLAVGGGGSVAAILLLILLMRLFPDLAVVLGAMR